MVLNRTVSSTRRTFFVYSNTPFCVNIYLMTIYSFFVILLFHLKIRQAFYSILFYFRLTIRFTSGMTIVADRICRERPENQIKIKLRIAVAIEAKEQLHCVPNISFIFWKAVKTVNPKKRLKTLFFRLKNGNIGKFKFPSLLLFDFCRMFFLGSPKNRFNFANLFVAIYS